MKSSRIGLFLASRNGAGVDDYGVGTVSGNNLRLDVEAVATGDDCNYHDDDDLDDDDINFIDNDHHNDYYGNANTQTSITSSYLSDDSEVSFEVNDRAFYQQRPGTRKTLCYIESCQGDEYKITFTSPLKKVSPPRLTAALEKSRSSR